MPTPHGRRHLSQACCVFQSSSLQISDLILFPSFALYYTFSSPWGERWLQVESVSSNQLFHPFIPVICYGQSPCIPQGLLVSKNQCQHTEALQVPTFPFVGRKSKLQSSTEPQKGHGSWDPRGYILPPSQPVFPVPTLLPAFPLLLFTKTEARALRGCGVYAHRCLSPLQQRAVHARGHRQLGMTADTLLLLPPFAFFPSRLTCSLPLQTGHSFLGKKRSH